MAVGHINTAIDDTFTSVTNGWLIRPAQRQILEGVDRDRPRLGLLELPTGVGKSAIAMTYGELLGSRTVVLTATISLQHQYERDFEVAVMKGRANYTCEDNGLSCAEGTCQVQRGFECDSEYYDMRALIRDPQTRHIVSNYALYMSELMYGTPPWGDKNDRRIDLLVCDEGHRLLDLLTEFEVRRLDAKLATELDIPNDGGWATLVDAQEWAEEWLTEVAANRGQAILDRSRQARKWTALWRQMAGIAKAPGNLLTLKTGALFEASPLWPHNAAERLLRSSKRTLVMSATMYGGYELAELLGYSDLPDLDMKFYTAPSPFPPHRWPVYFRPAGYPSHSKPHEWAKIAEAVHSYVHNRTEEKGVIHVTAANQVEHVLRRCLDCPDCADRLVYPRKSRGRSGARTPDRQELIRRYRAGEPGTWLCHYSVGEGEDFADDTARIQLIAKVPYPDLSDKLTKLRADEPGVGRRMYAAMTAARIAQMAGRGMRHNDDYCETYILDGNFGRLWSWNQDVFPAWFGSVLNW